VAEHEALLANLNSAVRGVPMMDLPLGWGGSNNYGRMRAAACYANGLTTDDAKSADAARRMLLEDLEQQKEVGLWARRGGDGPGQNEQLCPLPHSEFQLAALGVAWKNAILVNDQALARAIEENVGGHLALCRHLQWNGVKCSPSARAKDKNDRSNGAGGNQWRDRPSDAWSALVYGGRRPRYSALSVEMIQWILACTEGPEIRRRLVSYPIPKLSIPVFKLDLAGGNYLAWMEDCDANRRSLGDDALAWCAWGADYMPDDETRLGYDWQPLPAGYELHRAEVLGA
jgi:hypothetical protein